ncbi:hypothetical protein AB0B88_12045 [Micromonospora haikouensis]|uniref:lipopolysaccharide biosynthesis protein n=1 Tax=Micromonospora haikouensis TaxID=686309 RepID=UPI0033F3B30A
MASPDPKGQSSGLSKVIWFLVGLAMSSLGQWTIVLILAQAGSPHMVGQYALGLAITTPVVLVCGLGLQPVLVTDVANHFGFYEYLRLRLTGMTIALLVIGALVHALSLTGGIVIFLVGVAKALDAVGEIYFGILQRYSTMRTVGASMALNSVFSVLVTAGLLLTTGSITIAILGSVVGSALGSVLYPWRSARPHLQRGPRIGRASSRKAVRRSRRLAVTALPVGLAYSLTSFTSNVPAYVLEHQLGTSALGVFAVLSYSTMVANLLYCAVYQVLLHRMAELARARELRALRALVIRLVAGSLLLGLLSGLLAWVLGEAVLELLYGPDYSRHWPTLVILALGVGTSGALYFINAALLALQRFQHHLTATLPTLGITGAASFLLIPRYGLTGAASAAALALVVEALTKAALLRNVLVRAAVAPGPPPPADGPEGSPLAGPTPPARDSASTSTASTQTLTY